HYSGQEGEKDDLSEDDEYEQRTNLLTYRDKFLGIFTFMQLNVILEGLYSSTLDFQVFFYGTAGERKEQVLAVNRGYSVGHFAPLITARVRGDLDLEEQDGANGRPESVGTGTASGQNQAEAQQTREGTESLAQATSLLSELVTLATWPAAGRPTQASQASQAPRALQMQGSLSDGMAAAQQVLDSFLPPVVCKYLLRKFLQATASSVLQEYKRRVERCRRALLAEMLQVTHRQQPLLQ